MPFPVAGMAQSLGASAMGGKSPLMNALNGADPIYGFDMTWRNQQPPNWSQQPPVYAPQYGPDQAWRQFQGQMASPFGANGVRAGDDRNPPPSALAEALRQAAPRVAGPYSPWTTD
jgi:hypothetical protein